MPGADDGGVTRQMGAAEFAEQLDDDEQQLLMDCLRDGAFHAIHAEWSVTKPTPTNVTTEHLLSSLSTAISMLEAARAIVQRHVNKA